MPETNVTIHVIASSLIKDGLSKTFNPDTDGKIISTVDEIKVNKTPSGYSVVYPDDIINEIDNGVFVSKLILLLMDNLTGIISIDLRYHYIDINDEWHLNGDSVITLLKINDIIEQLPDVISKDGVDHSIKYTCSKDITELKLFVTMNDDEDDESPDEESDTIKNLIDEDDDFEVDENVVSILSSIIGDIDLSTDKKSDKSKKSKDKYFTVEKSKTPKSRVFKEAKNPKKEIKRHGVIITHDKEDLEKDRKIIKEFLKEFIPGKQEWVKEFRSELLCRWMKMYTIKIKDLKKIEKMQRDKKKDKERRKKNKKILDFTRNMFNVPISSWDDPNK